MSSLPGLDICCKSQLGFRFTFIPLTINQHVGGHDLECGLLYVSPWWHLSRQSGSWSLLGTYRSLKLGIIVYAIKGIQRSSITRIVPGSHVSPKLCWRPSLTLTAAHHFGHCQVSSGRMSNKDMRKCERENCAPIARTENTEARGLRPTFFQKWVYRNSVIFVMLSRFPPQASTTTSNINKEVNRPNRLRFPLSYPWRPGWATFIERHMKASSNCFRLQNTKNVFLISVSKFAQISHFRGRYNIPYLHHPSIPMEKTLANSFTSLLHFFRANYFHENPASPVHHQRSSHLEPNILPSPA